MGCGRRSLLALCTPHSAAAGGATGSLWTRSGALLLLTLEQKQTKPTFTGQPKAGGWAESRVSAYTGFPGKSKHGSFFLLVRREKLKDKVQEGE